MLAYLSHSAHATLRLPQRMRLHITCTLVWITRQVYEPPCKQISSTIEYILFPGQNLIATTYLIPRLLYPIPMSYSHGYTNYSFQRCLWKSECIRCGYKSIIQTIENSLNIDKTIGMAWILESMQSNNIHQCHSLDHSPISNYNSTHICTAV